MERRLALNPFPAFKATFRLAPRNAQIIAKLEFVAHLLLRPRVVPSAHSPAH